MKLASIVPMKNVERTFDGDYAMMLTHLAKYYPKRKDLPYASRQCYRILDNSLIELGGAVDMVQLIEAAEMCEADEIILPDVFKDATATLKSVVQAIEWLDDHQLKHKYRLMAVCQGDTPEEFERCFRTLESLPSIHCIGIPKVTETIHPLGRPGFEYLWQGSPKAIHLLGCWSSLTELREYAHPSRIRSVDTCIPALNALTGRGIWQERTRERTIDLINDNLHTCGEPYALTLIALRRHCLL